MTQWDQDETVGTSGSSISPAKLGSSFTVEPRGRKHRHLVGRWPERDFFLEPGRHQRPPPGPGRPGRERGASAEIWRVEGSRPRVTATDDTSSMKPVEIGIVGLWILPLSGDRAPKPFAVRQGFQDYSGQFSPNGRWVAYASAESGRVEVYVALFRGPEASGRSRRPAAECRYGARTAASSSITAWTALSWPRTFRTEPVIERRSRPGRSSKSASRTRRHRQYDVSPDGQRILVNLVEAARADPIQADSCHELGPAGADEKSIDARRRIPPRPLRNPRADRGRRNGRSLQGEGHAFGADRCNQGSASASRLHLPKCASGSSGRRRQSRSFRIRTYAPYTTWDAKARPSTSSWSTSRARR